MLWPPLLCSVSAKQAKGSGATAEAEGALHSRSIMGFGRLAAWAFPGASAVLTQVPGKLLVAGFRSQAGEESRAPFHRLCLHIYPVLENMRCFD